MAPHETFGDLKKKKILGVPPEDSFMSKHQQIHHLQQSLQLPWHHPHSLLLSDYVMGKTKSSIAQQLYQNADLSLHRHIPHPSLFNTIPNTTPYDPIDDMFISENDILTLNEPSSPSSPRSTSSEALLHPTPSHAITPIPLPSATPIRTNASQPPILLPTPVQPSSWDTKGTPIPKYSSRDIITPTPRPPLHLSTPLPPRAPMSFSHSLPPSPSDPPHLRSPFNSLSLPLPPSFPLTPPLPSDSSVSHTPPTLALAFSSSQPTKPLLSSSSIPPPLLSPTSLHQNSPPPAFSSHPIPLTLQYHNSFDWEESSSDESICSDEIALWRSSLLQANTHPKSSPLRLNPRHSSPPSTQESASSHRQEKKRTVPKETTSSNCSTSSSQCDGSTMGTSGTKEGILDSLSLEMSLLSLKDPSTPKIVGSIREAVREEEEEWDVYEEDDCAPLDAKRKEIGEKEKDWDVYEEDDSSSSEAKRGEKAEERGKKAEEWDVYEEDGCEPFEEQRGGGEEGWDVYEDDECSKELMSLEERMQEVSVVERRRSMRLGNNDWEVYEEGEEALEEEISQWAVQVHETLSQDGALLSIPMAYRWEVARQQGHTMSEVMSEEALDREISNWTDDLMTECLSTVVPGTVISCMESNFSLPTGGYGGWTSRRSLDNLSTILRRHGKGNVATPFTARNYSPCVPKLLD